MSQVDRLRGYYKEDPGNVDLACAFVDALLESGQVTESIAVLERVPTESASSPFVRFRRARCALVSGNAKEAASVLTSLLADGIDKHAVRHDLAYAELALGHVDAARAALAPCLLDEATIESPICRLQARVLHWHRDLDGALQWVDRALHQQSDDGEALALRALILLDQDRYEEAAHAAVAAQSGSRSWPDAELVLGTLALWSQRLDDAKTAFSRVLETSPGQGRALSGLGQVLMLSGDVDQATAALEQATRSMPMHIGTWHALAWCRLLSGDVEGARTAYEQAFALDRSFGETHGGLAVIHALRGEREAAEAALTRARRLEPLGRNAVYAQALLLLDEGHGAQAGQLVAGVLKGTPAAEGMDGLAFLRMLRSRMTAH
jgi:Flp pilus assembly protein TadD